MSYIEKCFAVTAESQKRGSSSCDVVVFPRCAPLMRFAAYSDVSFGHSPGTIHKDNHSKINCQDVRSHWKFATYLGPLGHDPNADRASLASVQVQGRQR
eukprot:COSAG02_NODE_1126_length_14431_cov_37.854452_9_plen_99_part_00